MWHTVWPPFEWHSQQIINFHMFRPKQKHHSWQRSRVCELVGWGEKDSRDLLISHCEVSQGAVTESSYKTWMRWKRGGGVTIAHGMLCVQVPPLPAAPPMSFSQLSIIINCLCEHVWHTSFSHGGPSVAICWHKQTRRECSLKNLLQSFNNYTNNKPLVCHLINALSTVCFFQ